MLPRKQRILLMVIVPILIIVLIVLALMLLLFKTDFMKSNDELFKKYLLQNFSVMGEIADFKDMNTYKDIIETSSYEASLNTHIVNSQNSDENITISIDGKRDAENKIDYKDIQIKNNDNKLLHLEYMNKENMYGIRFSDFFKQYISVKNENLKELLAKFGMTEEQLQGFPDEINAEFNIFEGTEFTEEEKKQLYNKYTQVIFDNISKDKYTKQKNMIITVNDESINTNAYKLTLSKEEYNDIIIKLLENLKDDEILISKLEIVEQNLSNLINSTQQFQIKDQIVESLENSINELKSNNIGTDQIQITVYQYKGKLVRTLCESAEENITIDINSNKKISIERKEISEVEEKTKLEISKEVENTSCTYNVNLESINGESNGKMDIVIKNGKVDNTINKDSSIIITQDNNSVNIETKEIINLKEVSGIETLDETNNIVLNDLDKGKIEQLLTIVAEKITTNLTGESTLNATSVQAYIESLMQSYTSNSVVDDGFGDANTVTELEKNTFNSKYEFYEGEAVKGVNIKSMLEVVANDLGGIEVVNNDTLKILIERGKVNNELKEKISNVIKKEATYKVEIGYDDSTGFIKTIILTKNSD